MRDRSIGRGAYRHVPRCTPAHAGAAFVAVALAAAGGGADAKEERDQHGVGGAAATAPGAGAAPLQINGSGLDFLECEGPRYDPAWAALKRKLLERGLGQGARIREPLASQAADLLDVVETQDFGAAVAAFGARLRGDVEAEEVLGSFCLYGAVAAYAAVAVHLARGADEGLPPTAKSSVARALLLLAKKQSHDFLESSGWPVRSLELVAMIEGEDAAAIRALPRTFRLPCHLSLGCAATRLRAEDASGPPEPPLAAAWPSEVAAIGLHITSTLEAVTALRGAVEEAWGRGGAAGAPFRVQYAGHPCPTHSGSEHQCQMKCDLLGACGPGADAADPLAEFIAGAVDVARFEERESYSLAEARTALRWLPRRLAPLEQAELLLCTFPTVLCVLLHELFPEKPLLFVAVANPLFAAPGCTRREDTTVRECETEEAGEYLRALRAMLQQTDGLVRGVAAYSVTAALVGYQAGVRLPLAGKAGRYLPAGATWRLERESEVLLARSRFLETAVGSHLRSLLAEMGQLHGVPLRCVLQQESGAYLSYEELSTFRAVIILPQDLGLHKFTEHYAMGMPIWVPGREWAYRLQMFIPWGMVAYSGNWYAAANGPAAAEGPPPGHPARLRAPDDAWPEPGSLDLAHPPFFNAQTVPYPLAKVAFWYEFSEFVAYPGVQHFGSVPGLLLELASADLFAISAVMRRFRAELWRTTRAVYAEAASGLARAAAAHAAA